MKPPTMTPVYAVMYARMAEAARSCGYALAVHGSLSRDLDVVAIPWTEAAASADEVVRAMAEVTARRVGGDLVIGYQPDGTPRPHGRVGYSIPFSSTDGLQPDGYVDVSVMPRAPEPESAPDRCPNCENGSGYTRRVGRDNDEIVDDCPNHMPRGPREDA